MDRRRPQRVRVEISGRRKGASELTRLSCRTNGELELVSSRLWRPTSSLEVRAALVSIGLAEASPAAATSAERERVNELDSVIVQVEVASLGG